MPTVGQILVNEALPEDLRDYHRVLDKKELTNLLRLVKDKYPDRYKEIEHDLETIGGDAAYSVGSSLSIKDLKSPPEKKAVIADINKKIKTIERQPGLTDTARDDAIVEVLVSSLPAVRDMVNKDGLKNNNSFTRGVVSGARGNLANVSSLRGADLVVLDQRDRPIPVPILSSYSEGLSPAEYFASSYGTRKGIVTTKMATADAGFLSKQLVNAAGELLVSDEEPTPGTGYPVDADDEDNEGAVLAKDYGKFSAGTVITPSISRELRKTHKSILIHSPISAGGHGVPKLAAGVRERGGLSPVGDNVGIAAAQAVGEPLSQSQLSSKHGAGVVGSSHEVGFGGFEAINQLVQVPKSFRFAATLANKEGVVSGWEPAPAGGFNVTIGGEKHYVSPDRKITVKVGDKVEAGDALTDGIPNPAEIVKYKHIGEGRRYLTNILRNTMKSSGISVNRRNLELLSRGLIRHVKVTDLGAIEGALPDDIMTYDDVVRYYKPRDGHTKLSPNRAKNKYLESPTLHYTIGTRITPSVINTLKEHEINEIDVHDEPPPFEPHMVRAMESSLHDPDFVRRLQGFYIGKGFLDAVHRGGETKVHSTNWGHSLAEAVDFGKDLKTKGIY